jgi:hypothetical protein
MDRRDWGFAVLRRTADNETAIGFEARSDDLGPRGDLVGRDRLTEERLESDIMGEMSGRVDNLHVFLLAPSLPGYEPRIAAVTSSGR